MTNSTTNLLDRITVNPRVLVGKPTIRGLRISVEHVLKALAAGISATELCAEYSELEPDDIRAVLAYAADLLSEERVFAVSKMAPAESLGAIKQNSKRAKKVQSRKIGTKSE